jgi:tetratricopeptide (TPR) repeat protein
MAAKIKTKKNLPNKAAKKVTKAKKVAKKVVKTAATPARKPSTAKAIKTKAKAPHKAIAAPKPKKAKAAKQAKPVKQPAAPKKSKVVVAVRPSAKPSARLKTKPVPPVKERVRISNPAIQAYEHGLKLMHAEEYGKAVKAFQEVLTKHPEEPEIQDRARALMQAAEKKVQEKHAKSIRSADDHYNMGIAQLNSRQMEAAIQHFQSALKLSPKAEHILYAMAAAHAIQGNRDQALSFLKHSMQYRPENRFLAARDTDFEALRPDSEFQQLLISSEK